MVAVVYSYATTYGELRADSAPRWLRATGPGPGLQLLLLQTAT